MERREGCRQAEWKWKRNNLHFLWQNKNKTNKLGCAALQPRAVSFTSAMSHLLHPHVSSPPSTFPSSPRTSSQPGTEKLELDGFTRKANFLIAATAIVCVSMEKKPFFFPWATASSRLLAHVALRRKSAASSFHLNPSRTWKKQSV